MYTPKRPFVLFFTAAAFCVILFSSTTVRSYKTVPPAYYANDPNPFQSTLNCTFCHSSFTAFHDSTNFILQMGTDSQSLSEVTSGVTTYTPGVKYFMRISTASPSAIHGFELTADDTTNVGTGVTNFAILDPSTTSLIQVSYNFVAHHNASSNNQWTFTWTAPTSYKGLVTFYYAGNNGVTGDTNFGDSIFVASKALAWSGLVGVANIEDRMNGLSVFPTVFDQHINVSFNLKESGTVVGNVIDLNGQVVKGILHENVSAGNFNRSFDLDGLSAGIYLVKLQVGDAFTVSKIVKQ